MAFEQSVNLAVSTVATAPSPASSGTSLVVGAGEGARFGTPPFNVTVFPAAADPTPANAEIVRVTARSTDTFSTIVRAQESTVARSIVVGDRVVLTPTAKTFTDIQSYIDAIAGVLTVHGNDTTIHRQAATNYATMPLTELDRAYTSSAYANNLAGWNLTQTGFTVLTGQLVMPADTTGGNIAFRAMVGAASAGQVRLEVSFWVVAAGGSLSASTVGTTGTNNVSLTANTLAATDWTTSTAAAAGALVVCRFTRNGDHASDTLAATAFLQSLAVAYPARV
jgi:hypothetical protein